MDQALLKGTMVVHNVVGYPGNSSKMSQRKSMEIQGSNFIMACLGGKWPKTRWLLGETCFAGVFSTQRIQGFDSSRHFLGRFLAVIFWSEGWLNVEIPAFSVNENQYLSASLNFFPWISWITINFTTLNGDDRWPPGQKRNVATFESQWMLWSLVRLVLIEGYKRDRSIYVRRMYVVRTVNVCVCNNMRMFGMYSHIISRKSRLVKDHELPRNMLYSPGDNVSQMFEEEKQNWSCDNWRPFP